MADTNVLEFKRLASKFGVPLKKKQAVALIDACKNKQANRAVGYMGRCNNAYVIDAIEASQIKLNKAKNIGRKKNEKC